MKTMKEQILEVVRSGRRTSFAQLQQRIPGFEGHKAIGLAPNVYLWNGVSQSAADAIMELMNTKKVRLGPASVVDYAIDGITLPLPIAQAPKAYKKPHWLPAVIDLPETK